MTVTGDIYAGATLKITLILQMPSTPTTVTLSASATRRIVNIKAHAKLFAPPSWYLSSRERDRE